MSAVLDLVRQSFVCLRVRRQFTAFAILALGIGIGANCMVFALLNTLFLRAMPYEDVDRLVEIANAGSPGPMEELGKATSFTGVAAFTPHGFSIRTGRGYRNLYGFRITPNLFRLLGVKPALGRALEPEDLTRPVVVLSYNYWRQISGSPDVIGQTLTIAEDQPRTIVGVLAADFTLQVRDANVFVPAVLSQGRILARLKPGVTPKQAEQEVTAIIHAVQNDTIGPDTQPRVTPITQSFRPNDSHTVSLFQAAVGLVLLITCANLANLLLVHGSARRRELAIRAAIGAGRARLFGQLITENLIIALAGGCLGLILASLSLDYLERSLPGNMTRIMRGAEGLSIDARVVAFTFLLSVTTVLLFGLTPAMSALRFDLVSSLKETKPASSRSPRRFGNLLVVVEVGLAFVLLVAGGLTLKNLIGLYNRDLGFTAERVLRAPVELPLSLYPATEQRIQALRDLEQRLGTLPGVEDVAIAGPQLFPFGGPAIRGAYFTINGRPESQPRAEFYYTTPNYFRLLHIPLMQGRSFTESDVASSVPVGLVSEVVAKRYQLGEGQQVRQAPGGPLITIIGVVGNVRNPVGDDFTPIIYRPLAQTEASGGAVMIRTAGDPLSIVPAVRREVLAADPNSPELRVANLGTAVANYVSPQLFTTSLLGTFAFIGLLLVAVGVFAVTRYWVSIRIPEIGIRMAMGADRTRILVHVLTRSAVSAAIGVIAGLAGAVALHRVMASQLHGVNPLDPSVIAAVAVIVSLTAIAAALLPALSATRVDPAVALRQE